MIAAIVTRFRRRDPLAAWSEQHAARPSIVHGMIAMPPVVRDALDELRAETCALRAERERLADLTARLEAALGGDGR